MLSLFPRWPRRLPGFLLVEVMMGVALFAIFLLSAGMVLLNGQESTEMGGDRVRAAYIAGRNLEAVRDIRAGGSSFDTDLSEGDHGVQLNAAGVWEFNATQQVVDDYNTRVTISTVAQSIKQLDSKAWWKRGYSRSGSLTITTELTDWQKICAIGNWVSPSHASYPSSGASYTMGVAGSGVLFLASNTQNGVHVFNATTHAFTTGAFSLESARAVAVAVKGSRLYVLDDAGHLRLFNISSLTPPVQEMTTQRQTFLNTPTSMRLEGNRLLVGLQEDAAQPELRLFDVSSGDVLKPLATGDAPSTVNGIAFFGSDAYVALNGTNNPIFATFNMEDATLTPVTILSSTKPALSIARAGTGLLLGAAREMPSKDAKVWYYPTIQKGAVGGMQFLASGSIVGADLDPTGAYGFVAADARASALQIFSLRTDALHLVPWEVFTWNADPSMQGRSVIYDPARDRLYLLTSQGVTEFVPGSNGSTPCSP